MKLITKFRRLRAYLKPFKLEIFGAFIALLLGSASVLSLGVGIRYFIDQGFNSGSVSWLNQTLLLMLAGITLLALSTFFRYYFVYSISEKLIAKLKTDLFTHLLSQKLHFFNLHQSGDLLSRISVDTTILQMILATTIPIAVRNSLLLIGGIILIFLTSIKLTVLLLILIPLIIFPILYFSRKIKRLSSKNQSLTGQLNARAAETLTSMPIVKAFQKEAFEEALFKKQITYLLSTIQARILSRASMAGIIIFLITTGIGFVLWVGGQDVLTHTLSPGALSAFIFYAFLTASAFGGLSEVSGDLNRAAGATSRIFELFALNDIEDLSSKARIKAIKTEPILKIENLSFNYPGAKEKEDWKLTDISLSIEKNEMIAFVGPSGAGKSTFFQLLLAFYKPDVGNLKLWGENYSAHSPQIIRNFFSYVAQDSHLFSGSIKDNIAYGSVKKIPFQKLQDASIKARAHAFIKKIPMGYNTELGEKGLRLSGGQKQRISIARALLKEADILLLDEATSALDNENERLFYDALDALQHKQTILLIAHRLSTAEKADRIVVMNEGKIEAIGTHKALLKSSKTYQRLQSNKDV